MDDPYEAPVSPEIILDTVNHTPEENARKIVAFLQERGFLLPDGFTNGEESDISEDELLIELPMQA